MASPKNPEPYRENWATKIGVILAVAGSAVGLGNFLRFPGVAVQNGGGAFMIPYFIAFLLVGIPICWAEWIMGRRAGRLSGLSSSPGIFGVLTQGNTMRFVGALGLFIPVVIYMYYVYVESWCLAFSFFMANGDLMLQEAGRGAYAQFFEEYSRQSQSHEYFSTIFFSYTFFLATFFINFYFIYRGLSRGIELFCRFAMPALILMAIILAVRVATLGTPDPAHPEQNIFNGLGYLWNPDWSALADAEVWINACGQIFFSLSVGFGIIITYASYLSKKDDVVLSGLTASSMNEFCEVCLGSLIVIPAAFVMLGTAQMESVADAGTFSLAFVVMPQIFGEMPGGQLFGAMFFFLLFLAGVTSSLSMLQPAIAFLEEGFGLNRKSSVAILGLITFMGSNAIIFAPGLTAMDTVDKYTNNIGIPLLALFEVLIFIFILKVANGVKEASYGADMKLPKVFQYVIYVSPVFLIMILGWWVKQQFDLFYDPSTPPFNNVQVVAILAMIAFLIMLGILQSLAWPRMQRRYRTYQKVLEDEES